MAEECLMSSSLSRPQQSFHTFNTGTSAAGRSNNNLECRVCEEGFSVGGEKVPRLLYCGHTLCHACLLRLPLITPPQDSSSGGVICCPFDRQPTPVASQGVWGLKKNFALLEVLERSSGAVGGGEDDRADQRALLSPDLLTHHQGGVGCGSVPCDEDESHAAVLYCTVCASHLCQACSERSHATRTLHTHRRIPIADKPREKPRCPAHPSHTVEFVCLEPSCTNSSPLMCFICKDYKHTKHKHALLESEAESVRQELSAAAHNIRRTALNLTHTLNKLELTARQLEEPPADPSGDLLDSGLDSLPLPIGMPSSASLSAAIIHSAAPDCTVAPPNTPQAGQHSIGSVMTTAATHNSSGSINHSYSSGVSVMLGSSSATASSLIPVSGIIGSQQQHGMNSQSHMLSSSPGGSASHGSSLISRSGSTLVAGSHAGGLQLVGGSHVGSTSHVSEARGVVREHFSALRRQLQEQESVAVNALETHVRERLCSIRQQQEDLTSLISQMVGLVLESERCLQQDDGRVLVGGRSLTAKLQLLQQQQPQLDAIEQGLSSIQDNIPITFTKDNRIHIGAVLEMRVVTLGLDGAGKTSILFQLQQNTCSPTIPTIGFNVETLHYKNFKFTIWDVGGQPKLRPLWRHYYYNTQAIIFVVDSSDPDRLEEAMAELTKLMMERELRDAPLLIYANKQGVPGALSPPDVSLALGAGKLCSGRAWHVVACDASTGDGLTDGLDWLTRQLGPLTS